jgi:hypothetical protein
MLASQTSEQRDTTSDAKQYMSFTVVVTDCLFLRFAE